MNALVTNGEDWIALAIARSLGKKDVDLTIAANSKNAISFYSKYCKSKIIYEFDKNNDSFFIKKLLGELREKKYDILIPSNDTIIKSIFNHEEKIKKYTKITPPGKEILNKSLDKSKTLEIALESGVPIPKTYFIDSISQLDSIENKITYPAVIKPHFGAGAMGVSYVNSFTELKNRFIDTKSEFGTCMIQEFVSGQKYTIGALFGLDGRPRRVCVQKTIREFPVSGGYNIYTETVKNPEVLKYSLKLLRAMNYQGIAMVDFIMHDGTPKLMEINPRLYSSVSLPIAAGVDFPYHLYTMTQNGDISKSLDYKVGVRSRHFYDDLRHLFSILKNGQNMRYRTGRLETFLNFIKARSDADYVYSRDDIIPFFIEFRNMFGRKLGF